MELDQDLLSRQQARELARLAGEAQKILSEFAQEKLDAIVEAVGEAFSREAGGLCLRGLSSFYFQHASVNHVSDLCYA